MTEQERNPLVLFLAELAVKRAEQKREIAERRANMRVIDGRASRVNRRQRQGDGA